MLHKYLTFGLLLVTGVVLAGTPMDKVIYQSTAQRWVETQTAKVTVDINATVDKQGLAATRAQLINNLNRIAKANWRITRFNRRQESSGLEQVQVNAFARVAQRALTNLHSQAQAVSKPGAKYRIVDISPTPELSDVEKTRELVRADLYQAIEAEVNRLNKIYPKQTYSVHRIDFTGSLPTSRQKGMPRAEMLASAADITVSNQVKTTATVVIAATRGDD